ncbi:hypothetical protein Tco_0579457 [Tanacetum coccineum]
MQRTLEIKNNRSRIKTSLEGAINVSRNSSKPLLAIDGAGFNDLWQMKKSLQTWLLWLFQTLSKRFWGGGGGVVSEDTSNKVRESPDASLVEELVSNDKLEKKTVFPTVAKINFVRPQQQEKPARKLVKYAKMYRSMTPRGNQRNWNNQKSQQLGSDFVMYNKAYFVCGSFNHVQASCNYHQRERIVGIRYSLKDKNKAKTVKTEHENG